MPYWLRNSNIGVDNIVYFVSCVICNGSIDKLINLYSLIGMVVATFNYLILIPS